MYDHSCKVWVKLGVMSIFTFDADNSDECNAWQAAHPTNNFRTLKLVKLDPGVFEVWVSRDFTLASKVELWLKKARRFMTEVNDDAVNEL
jgi:hypothetical protein